MRHVAKFVAYGAFLALVLAAWRNVSSTSAELAPPPVPTVLFLVDDEPANGSLCLETKVIYQPNSQLEIHAEACEPERIFKGGFE